MIECVNIQNFRGIPQLEIEEMKRINLISGKNNIGKSTVLEAIFLNMDHTTNESFRKLSYFRGASTSVDRNPWEPLFYQMDTKSPIRIYMTEDGEKSLLEYQRDENYLPNRIQDVPDEAMKSFRAAARNTYTLRFHFEKGNYYEDGHFISAEAGMLRDIETSLPKNELCDLTPTRFVNNLLSRTSNNIADSISKMELDGTKSKIIDILKFLDPSIQDIVTLSVFGMSQLYIRAGGKLTPLTYAGDGVVNLLSICLSVMELKNGLVLIDELETGFHYSMYPRLWEILDFISKESNCQIIATTHSHELIVALSNLMKTGTSAAYYRLGNSKGQRKAFLYNGELLGEALSEEMEVR